MKTQYAWIFSFPKLSQERGFFLSVSYIDLSAGHSTKEAIDSFFGISISRKAMKTLRASFFSLMLVNLIKIKILHFLIAVLA